MDSIIYPLGALLYLSTPVLLVIGWFKWNKRPRERRASANLSLLSFCCSTLATTAALALIACGILLDRNHSDAYLATLSVVGFWISLISLAFAVAGLWGKNPLR